MGQSGWRYRIPHSPLIKHITFNIKISVFRSLRRFEFLHVFRIKVLHTAFRELYAHKHKLFSFQFYAFFPLRPFYSFIIGILQFLETISILNANRHKFSDNFSGPNFSLNLYCTLYYIKLSCGHNN
jgi:hypothetical protein